MAQSVQKLGGGNPLTPLGYINVPANGTPVCIMNLLDANNVNSPNTPNAPPALYPANGTEYTPTFRGLLIQGYKPNAGNNGLVANNGNVYLLGPKQGSGAGNKSDYGAMLAVVGGGVTLTFPVSPTGLSRLSAYTLYIDTDNNNEGALITAIDGDPG